MTVTERREVTVSVSGFEFSCPGCGAHIGEYDQVWTLLISGLRWPVCADCGRHWVQQQVGPQG